MGEAAMADTASLMVCYEAMARASRAMLIAARENDWDTVASLERHCAGIIGELRQGSPITLGDAQRKRRYEILEVLLAEDAEIRNLAQPWLAQLQSLLTRPPCDSRLHAAYG
jgi:flagellar protein FliT